MNWLYEKGFKLHNEGISTLSIAVQVKLTDIFCLIISHEIRLSCPNYIYYVFLQTHFLCMYDFIVSS